MIVRLKRPLGQLHLLVEGQVEKLHRQTKHVGMLECQRRVDEVSEPRRGKDIIKLFA